MRVCARSSDEATCLYRMAPRVASADMIRASDAIAPKASSILVLILRSWKRDGSPVIARPLLESVLSPRTSRCRYAAGRHSGAEEELKPQSLRVIARPSSLPVCWVCHNRGTGLVFCPSKTSVGLTPMRVDQKADFASAKGGSGKTTRLEVRRPMPIARYSLPRYRLPVWAGLVTCQV